MRLRDRFSRAPRTARTLLACSGATLAVLAVGPIASASADIKFQGNCTVTGKATFKNPLTAVPSQNDYHFDSSAPGTALDGTNPPDGTVCKDVTLNGIAIPDGKAKVHVDGVNQVLSCGASHGTDGDGYVTFVDGTTVKFLLDIVGTGTEVQLTIRDSKGNSISGSASFANYADKATTAKRCQPGNTVDPVTSLGFDAKFDNSVKSGGKELVSTGDYPPKSTYSGSTGGGTTTGSGGTTTTGKGTSNNNTTGSSNNTGSKKSTKKSKKKKAKKKAKKHGKKKKATKKKGKKK